MKALRLGLALVLALAVGVAAMFGPQAAYFAELFGARLRYTGFAFAPTPGDWRQVRFDKAVVMAPEETPCASWRRLTSHAVIAAPGR